ncbi:hypothetical protein QKW60_14105 [Defluviimonas aestuarii]|uniref:hypothetical protein n=1 Tax=Albidovulum aestuarii TaxID=1130726 RepID=UPI00249C26FE|nr:hypothetical protein [Defluviimonas aestuarii]MDI3337547.1 hypothetical protein [Defluviimonas aestuarii]
MTPALRIIGSGAVTAAGLTLPQSAAAFVAGIDGFREITSPDEFGTPQIVAEIPTDWRLRPDPATWLQNLAARAGNEALGDGDRAGTLLLCTPPSSKRGHPCWQESDPRRFRAALNDKLGGPFATGSRLVDGGPAALIGALPDAATRLARGEADRILLLGVDSLINTSDMARFRAAGRLHGGSAQGLVPGEAAGAVLLTTTPGPGMQILMTGLADEPENVLGERQSQGRAMQKALEAASSAEGYGESAVEFVVSNFNGERYGALEALIFRARFYRTHREYMATAYPAMSFGDTGSASAALALAVAADAFGKDYAPGRCAMLEIASEDGLRAAACLTGGPG